MSGNTVRVFPDIIYYPVQALTVPLAVMLGRGTPL